MRRTKCMKKMNFAVAILFIYMFGRAHKKNTQRVVAKEQPAPTQQK